MRSELGAIGAALLAMADDRGPVNLSTLGALLKRLALVYGRLANDGHRIPQPKEPR